MASQFETGSLIRNCWTGEELFVLGVDSNTGELLAGDLPGVILKEDECELLLPSVRRLSALEEAYRKVKFGDRFS
jgi:hypothetical protein